MGGEGGFISRSLESGIGLVAARAAGCLTSFGRWPADTGAQDVHDACTIWRNESEGSLGTVQTATSRAVVYFSAVSSAGSISSSRPSRRALETQSSTAS